MFQRFHEKLQEREGGFTLIELLVVILIIAILAAIAIPVFLKQREKGWASQVESALKNAATAEESFLTGSATGVYATTEAELATEGFKKASDVTALVITTDAGTEYCLQAGHVNLGTTTWAYDSGVGKPVKGGTCS
jgi:type IV pilus assembly protein PilA